MSGLAALFVIASVAIFPAALFGGPVILSITIVTAVTSITSACIGVAIAENNISKKFNEKIGTMDSELEKLSKEKAIEEKTNALKTGVVEEIVKQLEKEGASKITEKSIAQIR